MKKGTAKLRAAIRRRRFVKQYVLGGPGVAGNAAQSMLTAGLVKSEAYATVAGTEMMAKRETQAAIQRALDRAGATDERLMQELTRIALGDPREVQEWGEDWHRFIPSRLLDHDGAATVQSVSSDRTEVVSEHGVRVTTKLKLQQYNKVEALALLMKARGLLTYRLEHSAPGGGPIEYAVRFYLPAPARAREPVVIEIPRELPPVGTNGDAPHVENGTPPREETP